MVSVSNLIAGTGRTISTQDLVFMRSFQQLHNHLFKAMDVDDNQASDDLHDDDRLDGCSSSCFEQRRGSCQFSRSPRRTVRATRIVTPN